MRMTVLLISWLFMFNLFAKSPFFVEDKYFIKGYDPVAYLSLNKAKKGSEQFKLDYNGITILFSSDKNKETFQSNPSKYLPAYNGYCAYAMADSGDLVEVDPSSFKVVDNKVYLFYDGFFADTLKLWNKKQDDASQIKSANTNWKKYSK